MRSSALDCWTASKNKMTRRRTTTTTPFCLNGSHCWLYCPRMGLDVQNVCFDCFDYTAPLARQVADRAHHDSGFAQVTDALLEAPAMPQRTLQGVAARSSRGTPTHWWPPSVWMPTIASRRMRLAIATR